jgi:hypothetical protein
MAIGSQHSKDKIQLENAGFKIETVMRISHPSGVVFAQGVNSRQTISDAARKWRKLINAVELVRDSN